MRVYRSDKGGIGIWKLAGVVDRDDALVLLRTLQETETCRRGCFILDFENVVHVDFRAFGVLEDGCPDGACVLLCGLSDYILDIFAFVSRRRIFDVFPDWKKALRYIAAERGKLGPSPAARPPRGQ
jgi:anti-anti-sigma regulatory factor